ncbi:hypothetical protein HRbin09_00543 [bacterium HR09]|nr:hypothetical protein HRbin09_00543 [bacterium HR09]
MHRQALVEAILRLSALAAGVPELVECDLNPLLAFPDGGVAVDVRVRLEREGFTAGKPQSASTLGPPGAERKPEQ